MRSKKEWLKWFDSLNDNDLTKILEKRATLEKTPSSYDKKIYDFINEPQKAEIKKPGILNKLESWFKIKPFLSYGLSTAVIIFIACAISALLLLTGKPYNKTTVSSVTNEAYLIDSKNKKHKLKINDLIKLNNTVETNTDSEVIAKIDKAAKITINENTIIKFTELYKKKKIEKSNFYLNKGEASFSVNKLNEISSFKVETETLLVEVTGTEFIVKVNNKDTTVIVNEGELLIKPKFDLENEIKSIKRFDKNYSQQLINIISKKIILKKGETLEVKFSDFELNKKEINKIIRSVNKEIKKNNSNKKRIIDILKESKNKINSINKEFRNKTFIIHKKNEESIKKSTEKKSEEVNFTVEKTGTILNTEFKEKNTAISTDGKHILISSDSNGTIYCINPENASVKWKYSDPLLTDITSPVIKIKNKYILPTFDKIFLFDLNGSVIDTENITNGVNYWADLKLHNNTLYIPTSSEIYVYNNTKFTKLENLGKILGQLYITIQNENLYFLDSNELQIKQYNLKNGNIEWESDKLNNRSFSSPVIYKNNLFITDYRDSIYKFNLLSNSKKPDTVKLDTGIISDPIAYRNILYFIGNNGDLYKINTVSFKKAVKIVKIDKDPNYNIYLTKNLLFNNNEIYFSSNQGNLFYYDLKKHKFLFIQIDNKNALIGTPVLIQDSIYVIDVAANIYKIVKNYE